MRKKLNNDLDLRTRIAIELMECDYDKLQNEIFPLLLKKMQDFLVVQGHANKFRDIKKKNLIEIKGLASNGGERLIGKEVREKFGWDIIEANEKCNKIYPIWSEGVIKYASINGTHYTHFKVVSQTEKTFELEICEYKFQYGTFYLCYEVSIKEISKYMPFYISKMIGKDVRTTFSGLCSKTNNDFGEDEKILINSIIGLDQNAEDELTIIVCNTISYIRTVNLLWEMYQHKNNSLLGNTFYDNEYFLIKNWKYDDKNTDDLDEIYHNTMNEYIDNMLNPSNDFKILKEHTIEKIINGIIQKKDIVEFNVAVGFVFLSGLKMINDVFESIYKNHGECRLIIGSLQHMGKNNENNKIDKSTVKQLEYLRNEKVVNLYTYKSSFYHGKFYYMSDQEYAYVILGSSNISKTAFDINYEMDVLYIVKKNSEQGNKFLDWYERLIDRCDKIEYLDIKEFNEQQWSSELDVFQIIRNKKISLDEMKKRISTLTDEETKFRFMLWMEHEPTEVYENINIDALKTYTMFVFAEKDMVVFESFVPQNAFYVFGCPNGVEDLISNISVLTKTQMRFSAHYIDRGIHGPDLEKLRSKINKLFI